ncbi:MAG: sodium:proton antiporter [Chitinophagaceae bacterium]|nr:MAG: sodium:proton antiporter [Chitinophagaceae bacterium]
MTTILVFVFVLGYVTITLEHPLRLNKAATALVTGVLCWTVFIMASGNREHVAEGLMQHLGDTAQILFFLMGAMTIVELIDAHDGFEIITQRITTRSKRKLIWILCTLAFALSAVLDNLTTTIVMVSLARKLITEKEDRLYFAGAIVVAANAGGAWSPIGDVTTTMLWIGGQVTALNIIRSLFLPSLVCLLVPMLWLSLRMRGKVATPKEPPSNECTPLERRNRNIVFYSGLCILLLVPVFKTVTHLPPFMGILLGLGVLWIIVEILHHEKDEADRAHYTVAYALRKIDTPSILFFLGILLAISALESSGLLGNAARSLDNALGNQNLVVLAIGLLSAIVDNVPLVAASMGMYDLATYPTDHPFWEFLAYSTGTGGSALIIGSAAGIAAMGIEKIDFIWYLKRISWLALIGFFAGALVYMLREGLL